MDDQPLYLEPDRDQVRQRMTPAPRRGRKWLVAVAVIAAAAALVVWRQPWHPADPAQSGQGTRHAAAIGRGASSVQAVGVATAVRGEMPITLSAIGTVTPLATVTVRSQISGYLTAVRFTEGQTVKKGDMLAQVDSRPYEAALAQFRGQLMRDQALLKNAQLDLARFQKLSAQDSISRQNLDTQAATVLQDQGIVMSDQAQIDMQKLNILYCHITAPVDGRVGLRQVDAGNYVTAGDASGIVVITQLQPISVLFTLPEGDLTRVMARLRAGARLTATAYDKSNATRIATGTLETVNNQIDTTTGTIRMRASFANDDEALFPNQFVNIALLVDTLKDVVLVPTAAIQHGTPGAYVYLVKADNTVSVRKIETGPTDGSNTVITTGLAVGDRVVIDGADRLRDGAKVTIPAATNAGDKALRTKGSSKGTPGDSGNSGHRAAPRD